MRKNIVTIAAIVLILAVAGGVIVANSTHIFAAKPANTTAVQNSGAGNGIITTPKMGPTFPSYPTSNKHTTPVPTVGTCPQPLPQPGLIQLAPPNSDPTYYFNNEALVVFNGNAWYLLGGNLQSNSHQGVIVMEPFITDPCKTTSQSAAENIVRAMPTLHGSIVITGLTKSGTSVTFRSSDGTTGYFNYGTQTFTP